MENVWKMASTSANKILDLSFVLSYFDDNFKKWQNKAKIHYRLLYIVITAVNLGVQQKCYLEIHEIVMFFVV